MIDFGKLDKVIHERGRLSIMTLLASRPDWSFADLRQQLGMSDGNLITHLRTLESHGYLAVTRETSAGRRSTLYSLTPAGLRAFQDYLSVLEEIVRQGRQ